MKRKLAGIDFDWVLMDPNNVEPGYKMGKPMPGAQEALQELWNKGYEPVIFTNRGGERTRKHVEEWLNYFEIPYSYVTNIKEDFAVIIDDKARQFNGWDKEYV